LAEQQAAAELEEETREDDRITMDSAAPPDPEMARRFLERVAERETKMEERSEEKLQALDMPEERETAALLHRTFYEAYWLRVTGNFPDGRPLIYQDRRRTDLWAIWNNALNALSYGAA